MAYSYHISIAVVSARALRNKVIERPVLLGQFPHAVEANVALPVQNGLPIPLLSEKVDRLDIHALGLTGRRRRTEDLLREGDRNLGAAPSGIHNLRYSPSLPESAVFLLRRSS